MKQYVMPLTFDNGREFGWHSQQFGELTDPLPNNSSVKLNDAKPYHSWERDLNAK